MPLVSQEEGMLEHLRVVLLDLELVEVVHVELPDERREVVVLEVLGQDVVAEGLLLNDLETVSISGPRYDARRFAAVDDLVELDQEGGDMVHIGPLGIVHFIDGVAGVNHSVILGKLLSLIKIIIGKSLAGSRVDLLERHSICAI